MKSSSAQKSKKNSSKNKELKSTLCDIVKTLTKFSETDKKLEELANYCAGDRSLSK